MIIGKDAQAAFGTHLEQSPEMSPALHRWLSRESISMAALIAAVLTGVDCIKEQSQGENISYSKVYTSLNRA